MKFLGWIGWLTLWAVPSHAAESWLGIYMQGVKIGYSGTVVKEERLHGKPVTKSWTVNVLKSQMIGSELNMRIESTAWVGPDGRPLKMSFWTSSDGRTQVVQAAFSSKAITLEIDNNGAKTKKSLPIQPGMVIVDDPIGSLDQLLAGPTGKPKTVYILDSTTLSLVKNDVIYRGKQSVTLAKQEFKADMVEIVDPRAVSKVFYSTKGDVIKILGPMGMEMIPEEKARAMDLSQSGTGSIDLSEGTKVKIDKPIPDAPRTREVEIRATGIDLTRMISDRHQTVTRDGDAWIIRIHPLPPTPGLSIAELKARHEAWLKPSQHMPSDAAEMAALARSILDGEQKSGAAAEKIRSHVYGLMRSNTGIGVLRDASEVLRTKEGLCRDHAILTGTLLRAAGIPARLVSGMVYEGDAFYYHAWVEYWNGENWIGLDSTRPNPRLSAVHLKIAQGQVEDAFLFFVLEGAKFELRASNAAAPGEAVER